MIFKQPFSNQLSMTLSFSSKSKADASELLENLEDMFLLYYIDSDVNKLFKNPITPTHTHLHKHTPTQTNTHTIELSGTKRFNTKYGKKHPIWRNIPSGEASHLEKHPIWRNIPSGVCFIN